MHKVILIREIREKLFIERLEEILNTEEVIDVHYSHNGSINMALVVIREVNNGRKAIESGIQATTDSNHKRGRRAKKTDGAKS
jgi:hypothetical protein